MTHGTGDLDPEDPAMPDHLAELLRASSQHALDIEFAGITRAAGVDWSGTSDADLSIPTPGEFHPYYERYRTLITSWLNDRGYSRWLEIPIIPSLHQLLTENPEPEVSCRRHTLTRRRCRAPAPYVGDPFVYEWRAGVDELGRTVASDCWRVPVPFTDLPTIVDWGAP